MARVHGAHPIDTKPCACGGLIGTSFAANLAMQATFNQWNILLPLRVSRTAASDDHATSDVTNW
jgi:hypothetical protein